MLTSLSGGTGGSSGDDSIGKVDDSMLMLSAAEGGDVGRSSTAFLFGTSGAAVSNRV